MGKLTATHTYVLMEVSKATYDEIANKLRDAGYEHTISDEGELDLHGIALVIEQPNGDFG
jgi:hypothetical protein